jgi:hypothetical protein
VKNASPWRLGAGLGHLGSMTASGSQPAPSIRWQRLYVGGPERFQQGSGFLDNGHDGTFPHE